MLWLFVQFICLNCMFWLFVQFICVNCMLCLFVQFVSVNYLTGLFLFVLYLCRRPTEPSSSSNTGGLRNRRAALTLNAYGTIEQLPHWRPTELSSSPHTLSSIAPCPLRCDHCTVTIVLSSLHCDCPWVVVIGMCPLRCGYPRGVTIEVCSLHYAHFTAPIALLSTLGCGHWNVPWDVLIAL